MAIFKAGRIVVILRGRFAGRKAVVLRLHEEGEADRAFPHAVVAGIERYPRKITRSMQKEGEAAGSKSKVAKRSTVKPFVKHINLNHLMPTRYSLDIADQLKVILSDESLVSAEKLRRAKGKAKELMEQRYHNMAVSKSEKYAQGVQYFFRKLRF